ncbi:hypothetical protein IV203_027744 [Nitzschia inconspicua]|uniref:Uncharacterized protein n=1 Tax=Nitzschia inconspicua TaxID=303405 RepID=A0A9K3LWS5_9STRA|nr:hypothetical protein IV203_027744 [Nitzschia inconspicua]
MKKGTVQQAEERQSYLLLKAKAVIGKNITAQIPEWSDVTVPKGLEIPKTVRDFNASNKLSAFAPTQGWCRGSQYCPPHFEKRQNGVLAVTLGEAG